jgi:hypothetical protein
LPRGKPSFACIDKALDLVTNIANTMKPIYDVLAFTRFHLLARAVHTWMATKVLDNKSSAGVVESPAILVFDKILFSKTRYMMPTNVINTPPETLHMSAIDLFN